MGLLHPELEGPMEKLSRDLMAFDMKQCRLVTELLTVHCKLRRNLTSRASRIMVYAGNVDRGGILAQHCLVNAHLWPCVETSSVLHGWSNAAIRKVLAPAFGAGLF
jgi:hypothetical protein